MEYKPDFRTSELIADVRRVLGEHTDELIDRVQRTYHGSLTYEEAVRFVANITTEVTAFQGLTDPDDAAESFKTMVWQSHPSVDVSTSIDN